MSKPLRTRVLRSLAGLLCLGGVAVLPAACETFDAPPRVFVVDLVDGNLPDAEKPIVIEFSEPVDPATLKLKIVALETDIEGNLGDEDTSDATELSVFFAHEPGKEDEGGEGVLAEDNLSYTITLAEPLPVGPAMALLVEPGLADAGGTAWQVRQRIPFGYRFDCVAGATSQLFLPGPYFIVVDVEKPIPTQLQLWVWFDVDPEGGFVTGQFTNADRIQGGDCTCPEGEACRTVPTQGCVTPSEKAGTADEFVDFVANAEPPVGYTFLANGCVADNPDGSVSFGNAPVDVAIEQPPVTVLGTQLTAQFVVDEEGILRCSGSFTGEQVLLGGVPSEAASGTFTGRSVPEDQLPAPIPKPYEDQGEEEETEGGE